MLPLKLSPTAAEFSSCVATVLTAACHSFLLQFPSSFFVCSLFLTSCTTFPPPPNPLTRFFPLFLSLYLTKKRHTKKRRGSKSNTVTQRSTTITQLSCPSSQHLPKLTALALSMTICTLPSNPDCFLLLLHKELAS